MAITDQVREFHAAFGVPVASKPTVPDPERVKLRMRLIAEEFFELLDAVYDESEAIDFARGSVGELIDGRQDVMIIEAADALADLSYVIEGCNLEFGIDSTAVLEEVHRTNMAKLVDGKPLVREDGKVIKPEGWTPPDIVGVLARQRG